MTSLTADFKIGNTGASSLVKSAVSLESSEAEYQDQIQAFNWDVSAKDNASFDTYATYLQGRITALQATGSLTDSKKALTLQTTMYSATKANITSNIQEASIQVLQGGMSNEDKYSMITTFFNQSVANGDMGEAQSLQLEADDLQQTIQYDAQEADSNAKTLAEAGVSSMTEYASKVESTLKTSMVQLGGMSVNQQKVAIAGAAEQLKSAGAISWGTGKGSAGLQDVVLGTIGLTGTQGVYTPGSILWATQQALNQANNIGDYSAAQTAANKIDSYMNGTTKVSIPGATADNPQATHDLTLAQVKSWVDAEANGQNPYSAVNVNGALNYEVNPVAGDVWAKDVFTGKVYIQNTFYTYGAGNQGNAPTISTDNKSSLTSAGFTVLHSSGATVTVLLPKGAKVAGTGASDPITLILGPNGQYMTQTDSTHFYSINIDKSNQWQVNQVNVNGQTMKESTQTTSQSQGYNPNGTGSKIAGAIDKLTGSTATGGDIVSSFDKMGRTVTAGLTTPLGRGILTGAGDLLGGLGSVATGIEGILQVASMQQHVVQVQAQEAQAEAAAAQAATTARNQAVAAAEKASSAATGQARAAAAIAATPNSAAFLAPINATPSQEFAAASGGKTDSSSVAKGIAGAVGINPNVNLGGK